MNAYRLELARVKQEPSLIDPAPPALLVQLRAKTVRLHEALAAHEIALGAVKLITEGLVQAMAEEVARQRAGHPSTVRAASSPNRPLRSPQFLIVTLNHKRHGKTFKPGKLRLSCNSSCSVALAPFL